MSFKKQKVLLLYGGRSTEHDISRRSAAFILQNLNRDLYDIHVVAIAPDGTWLPQNARTLLESSDSTLPISSKDPLHAKTDLEESMLPMLNALQLRGSKANCDRDFVVFPMLHGSGGEDGTLQGLLELSEIAYVGPDHLGSAVAMDKIAAKRIAFAVGVPVVPYVTAAPKTWELHQDKVISEAVALGFPLFVKPSRLGSSVGISKVRTQEELVKACEFAFQFDERILIEKGMDVREIECAVIGDDQPRVSALGEAIPHADFYSYDAKYVDPNGAGIAIPAALDDQQTRQAQQIAKTVFQALDLYGMARVDLFLCKQTHKFYLNEVNTIPGMTSVSQFPKLWAYSGFPASELFDELIRLALTRNERRASLKRHL